MPQKMRRVPMSGLIAINSTGYCFALNGQTWIQRLTAPREARKPTRQTNSVRDVRRLTTCAMSVHGRFPSNNTHWRFRRAASARVTLFSTSEIIPIAEDVSFGLHVLPDVRVTVPPDGPGRSIVGISCDKHEAACQLSNPSSMIGYRCLQR